MLQEKAHAFNGAGDIRAAATSVIDAGFEPIPIPPGQKGPRRRGWERGTYTPANFTPGGNIGVHHTNITCVDCDVPEARKIAGRFYPPTLTTGRETAVDSHWWFKTSGGMPPYIPFKDLNNTMLLELRSGRGKQTVIPPSRHPDGERYKVAESGLDIAQLNAGEYERQARLHAVATLVARHLPPPRDRRAGTGGGRHDIALCLSGYLIRNDVTPAEAETVLKAAWDAAGYGGDARLRDKAHEDINGAIERATDRLRSDKPVTGGRALAEILPGIPERIARFLKWERTAPEPAPEGKGGGTGGKPNQLDLVERFRERYPDIAYGVGEWRQYERGVWSPIDTVIVEKAALQILREAVPEGIAPSSNLLASVVNILRVQVQVPSGEWANPERGIIVCQNGTLEIEGRRFREHRREDYALFSVAFDYDPGATASVWVAAFKKRLGASWEFLQEYAGYGLTTRTDLEAAAFLVGSPGCGKSTFIEGLEMVAGDQAGTLSLSDMERSLYALSNISGKTLLTATEAPHLYLKSTATLDALISGEPLQIERKYQQPERVRPVSKILWAMNELPQVRNPSAGLFRRAHIVPFPAVAPEERNPLVKQAIRSEGSGILNWALDGLDRLNARRGFTISPEMREAMDGFMAGNDVPALFVGECCAVDPERRERSGELYRAYKNWCLDNGYKPLASNRIRSEWERLGFHYAKVNGKPYFKGVELTEAPGYVS